MRNFKLFSQMLALMTGLLFFTSCQKDEIVAPSNAPIDERNSSFSAYPNVTFYGLGTANELYTYRSGPPATYISTVPITGLRDGEKMMAIDIRPSTKGLYGITDRSTIYQISTVSGLAQPVNQTPFTPAIDGAIAGFDFMPSTDRIRLITERGQNLRISPTTGMVTSVDFALTSGGGQVAINSIAYSNNYAGSFNPSLYDIDMLSGNLYRQSSTGQLTVVGSTGLTINGEGGFDISRTGAAYAVALASGRPTLGSIGDPLDDTNLEAYRLYSINLKSGAATSMGSVRPMIGIAIQ